MDWKAEGRAPCSLSSIASGGIRQRRSGRQPGGCWSPTDATRAFGLRVPPASVHASRPGRLPGSCLQTRAAPRLSWRLRTWRPSFLPFLHWADVRHGQKAWSVCPPACRQCIAHKIPGARPSWSDCSKPLAGILAALRGLRPYGSLPSCRTALGLGRMPPPNGGVCSSTQQRKTHDKGPQKRVTPTRCCRGVWP